MSGERDGDRRGSGWKDLMVTRPGPGAAAIEEMKDEIARLGETVTAQAERPDPATMEELEAWGSRFLERVGEAASGRAAPMTREEMEETVAGLADRIVAATAPDRELAARTGGAAEPGGAATEDEERTVREQLRWIVHLLTWKRAPIRQDLEGIRQTANGIDAGCAHGREAQEDGFVALSARLGGIEMGIGDLRSRRGVPFRWIILGAVAGMALEAWAGPLSRFLAWQGF
ncbi:MAG: hypothetical protein F4213_17565 [Boseongicola sp. SB0677_bin_26]|nr:hypothetical protein [Boseongicola sp. SB0665_bin_10]MYG27801.1 hypothetical protein [Boseongicola sp. SB0677_bin_26]